MRIYNRVRFRNADGLTTMRWLVLLGSVCLLRFLWWFFTTLRIGYAPLFYLLVISLAFKLLRIIHEWYHYIQVQEPIRPRLPLNVPFRTVDMLTTACPGEPQAMIIRTLEALVAVHYPHTTYLCDEGNAPELRAACQRLGVVHVTRTEKKDAKAGNINNALRQATGEFCVVLDPDHEVTPDFLDQVMPYFQDPSVGYVQVVQAYSNQKESLVALGAAEQTYHFYGPLMMGMNGHNTVQAIGANCTFRRAALDSIGGHAAGLTEDMHTAMRLHAAGWRAIYAPVVVSHGLVPSSLASFYSQQLKWSRGAFELLFRVYPRLFTRFTWAQRLHYLLLPLYFFSGVIALIDLSLPVLSLGLSQFPWIVGLRELALYALPLIGMALLIRCYAQRWLREPGEGGLHVAGGLLCAGTWWVYTLGFVYAILRVHVPYAPTPKEGFRGNEWRLALPNLLLAGLLLWACHYGRAVAYGFYTNTMVMWALFNVGILLAATFMGQHQVVRNFMADMGAKPFRSLVLAMRQGYAFVVAAFVPQVRRLSPLLALAGLIGVLTFSYFQSHYLTRVPPEWLLSGSATVKLGQMVTSESSHNGGTATWTRTESPAEKQDFNFDIAALSIAQLGRGGLLPAQVNMLAQQGRVPLLYWKPNPATMPRKEYWQELARQVKQVPGPVMLRPVFSASSPMNYRRAWKNMVNAFRQEKAINVIWVWTPDATDSLLQKFPGVAFVDWIASPLLASNGAPQYDALRAQLAKNLAIHQVPVLLLAPTLTSNPQSIATRLNWEYPEIKAVVFPESTAALPTATRSRTHLDTQHIGTGS